MKIYALKKYIFSQFKFLAIRAKNSEIKIYLKMKHVSNEDLSKLKLLIYQNGQYLKKISNKIGHDLLVQ